MAKTSRVNKVNREKFEIIIKNSLSLSDALRALDMSPASGNFLTLKKRIEKEGIDIAHIKLGIGANKGRKFAPSHKYTIDDILIESSTYLNGSLIKKRLLEVELLREQCYECNQMPHWNGKDLVLQLDHINGIHDDNRIENLRLLCPNCHTQTKTYAGAGIKFKKTRLPNQCIKCDNLLANGNKTGYCEKHYVRPSKIVWPLKEELEKMILIKPIVRIAKELGVSDKAVTKHCRKFGIKYKDLT